MPLRARHVVASVDVAVIFSACGSSNNVDRQRLAVLRRDAVATAQAPGTTPWLVQGQAGGRGIGFGGSSPTVLNVDRRLQGSRSSVTRFFAQTAIRSGWLVNSIRCSASSDSFAGAKQFPGWVAGVVVTVGKAFLGAQAVSINLETDYHGNLLTENHAGASATVAPRTGAAPLTVDALVHTCLGAPS
jgi:hypothetical protein